jgi:hypothetical protein
VRPALARRVDAAARIVLLRRTLGRVGADLARVGRHIRLLA